MAYVGNQPARGQWRKLSDISSGFDGVITTFTTSVPPGTSGYFVTAGSASQLLISLGGVIQEPDVDYTVSTNSITFTTPPTGGLSFFGVLCGDALNVGTPGDGTVTTSKLAAGAVDTAALASPIAPTVSSINGGPLAGTRNRIINGDMRIDQRNAGASVTPSTGQYLVDRWRSVITQASKFSVQRNAGSVTPPSGFTNYLGITSLSAYALTGNDGFSLEQIIEGFNVADFDWGTANAKAATLSFWVRSSLTGTFGGSVATTKAAVWVMPFTYSIPAANTWTYVTVSITAPTSTGGTNNDNTDGVYVRFGLGASGTSAGGTTGTWTSVGNYLQPSGTVSVVGTNGATFYITGVQLEPGTVATPFERRSYGQELALCQRYYQKSYRPATAPGASTFDGMEWTNGANARISSTTRHAVQMRSATTIVPYDGAGTANRVRTSAGDGQTGYMVRGTTENNFTVDYTSGGITELLYHWTASAEL